LAYIHCTGTNLGLFPRTHAPLTAKRACIPGSFNTKYSTTTTPRAKPASSLRAALRPACRGTGVLRLVSAILNLANAPAPIQPPPHACSSKWFAGTGLPLYRSPHASPPATPHTALSPPDMTGRRFWQTRLWTQQQRATLITGQRRRTGRCRIAGAALPARPVETGGHTQPPHALQDAVPPRRMGARWERMPPSPRHERHFNRQHGDQ